MNEEMIQKYADKLLEAMGNTAPEAWQIMLHGQLVNGIKQAMLAAMFWTVALFAAWIALRASKRCDVMVKAEVKINEGDITAVILGCIIATFFVSLGIADMTDAVGYLAAPEYNALRELLGKQ